MARKKRAVKPLPTIWRAPDDLWNEIQPVLDELDPPAKTGRPRTDARAAFDGIIFVLRTGCQWNVLPKPFGDDSSVHRALQRWIAKGVLDRIWTRLVESCEELGGVDFPWQSADAAMAKARFGGTMSGRIRRIVRKTG